MTWLQPLVWWGLVGLAVPVVIHLLSRHQTQRLPFPSLRFLQTTPMAAMRRRVVSNWPLLIVRVLIIVAATAALAGPVVVSDARRTEWNQRVARAIVVQAGDADAAAPLAEELAQTSFARAQFSSPVLADAVAAGVEWLHTQGPAARELVVIGDLHEGALTERDLELVPRFVGVQFLPVSREARAPEADVSAITEGPGGQAERYSVHVTIRPERTDARYQVERGGHLPLVRVFAEASDQPRADAILRAVLRDGVLLGRHPDRSVTIAFRGAATTGEGVSTPTTVWVRRALEENPEIRGGEVNGTLVATVDLPVTDARAPAIVARVLRMAFSDPLDSLEPRRLAPSTLARWSRAPGVVPADITPTDEGDRRWFWGTALLLLAAEQFLRRRRNSLESGGVDLDPHRALRASDGGTNEEARVA
jgi:hypothetical protein